MPRLESKCRRAAAIGRRAGSCPSHGFTTVRLVQRRKVVFFFTTVFHNNKVIFGWFFSTLNKVIVLPSSQQDAQFFYVGQKET